VKGRKVGASSSSSASSDRPSLEAKRGRRMMRLCAGRSSESDDSSELDSATSEGERGVGRDDNVDCTVFIDAGLCLPGGVIDRR
jgi:hypothetical protein